MLVTSGKQSFSQQLRFWLSILLPYFLGVPFYGILFQWCQHGLKTIADIPGKVPEIDGKIAERDLQTNSEMSDYYV